MVNVFQLTLENILDPGDIPERNVGVNELFILKLPADNATN